MKLSVVIPVYNTPEKYLESCINSLIEQKFEDYEIIIVDDGSASEISKCCDKLAKRFQYVQVIHQINKGVSAARNIGIEHTKGEYILFVDADDWVLPGYFDQLYSYAKETKADLVLTNAKICFADRQLDGNYVESTVLTEQQRIELLKTICGKTTDFSRVVGLDAPWGTLCSRKLLEKIRFPVGLKRFEDLIFSLEIYSRASTIAYYQGNMYCYRMSNSSTCRSLCSDIVDQALLIKEKLEKCIEKNPYYKELDDWKYVKVIMFSLTDCMTMYFMNENNLKSDYSCYLEFRSFMRDTPIKQAVNQIDINKIPHQYRPCVRLLKCNMFLATYMILYLNKKLKKIQKQKLGENYC